MSIQFYPIRIKEIQQETVGCVRVVFDIPADLKSIFAYTQGQYITLKATINNIDVRRSYSICSAMYENELSVAIKKVKGGVFSTWANSYLKVGDIIELMPPKGKFFTPLQIENNKNYLAFAAGSGITPILSIIKTTLKEEPKSSFTLVYSNKNIASIIFKETLEALKNKFPQRLQLIYLLSRERTDAPINNGRLGFEKMNQLSQLIQWSTIDDYFICGPEEMIFTIKDFLINHSIDKKQIHIELFAASTQKSNNNIITKENENETSKICLTSNGRTIEFDINKNESTSILDAALQQGADLPYACKGGVCCTCKAKLISGKVQMDVHWGLEDFEIEQGFILTCQSHPLTKNVVVDFDV